MTRVEALPGVGCRGPAEQQDSLAGWQRALSIQVDPVPFKIET